MTLDENHGFVATGIEPFHWQSTDPVRRIFQHAFTLAGLPYYHPHTFRHTLGHMAYTLNLTGEGLKAWSQNLGHENVNTTLTSYGTLSTHRQGEVIKGLGKEEKEEDKLDVILRMMQNIKGENV